MYLLFKSLHIISFVAWMAGLLYLPRLFVYHCEEKFNSNTYKKFELMEKRLLKFIMNPAMILTWFFGVAMLFNSITIVFTLWFLLKFILVMMLSAFHGFLSVCRKNFVNNSNTKSAKFYRLINEIPTVLLILIVFLVVFQQLGIALLL